MACLVRFGRRRFTAALFSSGVKKQSGGKAPHSKGLQMAQKTSF
jgi:hypothetical protein